MKSKYGKVVSLICAASLLLIPAGALAESNNSQATGNATSHVHGNRVEATSVGAMVQDSDNSVAIGASVQIVNVGHHGGPVVVENYGALAIAGEGNVAIGTNAQVMGGGSGQKALGYGAIAGYGNYNVAIGNHAYAGGSYGGAPSSENTALGAYAQAYGGGSVALGAGSIANEPNTVSVGTPGHERRIMNLAPGVYGTDAVNMNQLWDTHDKINRLGATAMAMTGLAPMAYKADEPTQYSASIGTYNGQTGFAVGLYHYTKENVMLSAAFGWSSDNWEKAGRAGITWRGGGGAKKDVAADKTVFASNVTPAQSQPAAAGSQGNIQDRVSKLLSSTSVQADKPAVTNSPVVQDKPASAPVKAEEKKPAVPEGGIQDRVSKLLKSTEVQAE